MIRAMLMFVALLSLGQQFAYGKPASDSDCQPAVSELRVVYCDSVEVGDIVLAAKKSTATLVVSFESEFFSGLERVKTSHGWEFRKAGRPVSNYPVEFALAIAPPIGQLVSDQLQKWSAAPLPKPAVRLPPQIRPRRVIVKWLDSSQRVLAEKCTDLEEVEEGWPEFRQPLVWYRATITGVKEALASGVEVLVIGDDDALLGTMHGRL